MEAIVVLIGRIYPVDADERGDLSDESVLVAVRTFPVIPMPPTIKNAKEESCCKPTLNDH